MGGMRPPVSRTKLGTFFRRMLSPPSLAKLFQCTNRYPLNSPPQLTSRFTVLMRERGRLMSLYGDACPESTRIRRGVRILTRGGWTLWSFWTRCGVLSWSEPWYGTDGTERGDANGLNTIGGGFGVSWSCRGASGISTFARRSLRWEYPLTCGVPG